MLKQLISEIAPKSFDPVMLRNTEFYINILVALFIIFFILITFRVFIRWIGVLLCRVKIRRSLKKTTELRRVRQEIPDLVSRYCGWAKEGFQEFRMAWEEARLPEESKAVLPIRLREFLTPEMVLDNVRNRRMAEALPGIFVALGIFGTFLGLVLGLGELEFGKLENLQNGVSHLISGLSLAFLTSLAGIALSIVFSLSYRLSINRLERSFLALDGLLCRIYPFESQERYARRYIQMQADVKQGLQTLATDVAMQISGAIGPQLAEALQRNLIPVMRDLHSWIEKHIQENRNQQNDIISGFNDHITRLSKVIVEHFKNSQDRQSEAMEAVLQHYSSHLTETFQKQFEAMGRVIEDTTKAQQEIKQQFVDFGEQLNKQFQSQGELIEKTNKAGEILGSSLDSLESIAQKLKLSADDISSAAELLEHSASSAMEGQKVLKETMVRQIETMVETRNELEGSWREITENAAKLVEQVSATIQELASGIGDNLIKALDSFDGKVAEVVERFSGTLFEASQTISEMPQLAMGMNENLQTISNGVNEQKNILTEIRETSKSVFSENIQMVCEASKELGESAGKIGSTSTTMNEFFGSFSDKFLKGANLFEQRNRQALSDLNSIINELIVELRQGQSLLDSKGPLGQTIKRLESLQINPESKNYTKIEESIGKPIQSLTEQLSEIIDVIQKKLNNGDAINNDDIVEKISAIEQRIQIIGPGLKQALARLANVDKTVTKIAAASENKINTQTKTINPPEKKRSLFGFGSKN